jgi:hypothetical protein
MFGLPSKIRGALVVECRSIVGAAKRVTRVEQFLKRAEEVDHRLEQPPFALGMRRALPH